MPRRSQDWASLAGRRRYPRKWSGSTIEAPEKLVGKPIQRREDPNLMTGRRQFPRRYPTAGHGVCGRPALAGGPRQDPRASTPAARPACPACIGVFTGEDLADVNPLPCAWQAAGVDNNVATPRLLALGEVRQVGDPVAVVVAESVYQANDAARGDRGRLRRAAGGRRLAEAIKPRRAATPRERAEQHRHALDVRHGCGDGRRGAGRGRGAGQPEHRQPAPDPDRDGAARLDRPLRSRHRGVHPVGDVAGAARAQACCRGVRARHSGAEDPRHRAGRRRRVRLQDLSSTSTCRWCCGCRSSSAGR